ncbi:EAL domain-containing protein [Leptolyngbya iicbica]|uniref:EAL domain-containing protein n=2 Tax=Cyanophyceae TaxID=3028117 RepID=A0A4Q7EDY9_9CYAN|nr:EAL domain-containing protein [Leptolyngbya sp. LK]RZM82014.1 EAL domain-containing protein [Leptolyngbya sp. LK]
MPGQPSSLDPVGDNWSQICFDPSSALLLNAINQAVIATDAEGNIRFWNQAAESLYGWPQSEVLGRPISTVTPALNKQQQSAEILADLRQGKTWSGEFQVRDRHNREFTALVHTAPIHDATGNLLGLIGVSSDISELKTTQAQLEQQTQQTAALHRVVDAIHQSLDLDTIFSVSASHIAELLNAQVSIVQYLPERQCWIHRIVFNADHEPVTKTHDVIPDQDNPFAERLKRLEVVQVNDTRTIQDPVNSQLAKTDPGAWLLTPISIGGKIWGSLTLGRLHQYVDWSEEDIQLAQGVAAQLAIAIEKAETYQQLQQELSLREANEERLIQYEHIVSATQDGLALLNCNYVYRVVNQVYLDWNQKSRQDIIGHSVADLLGQETFQAVIKPRLDECLQGNVVQYSDWFTFPEGRRRFVHLTYAPFVDDDGEVHGVVATSRDVTDLQLAQETLRRQAQQERAVNDIIKLMRQSFEIESLFPLVLEDVCRLLAADHGAIARYEMASQSWQHIAEYRANEMAPSCLDLWIPDAENPLSAALTQGEVICVDDSKTLVDPLHRQLAKQFPGAWLIVPLRVSQRIWGNLTLRKVRPTWAPEAVALSSRIADQLAIAIHQSELFHSAQAELQKRQATEQALRDQQSFFTSLYEQATLGIAFCQSDGQIVQANAKYCALTGYSERELQLMSLSQLVHPDDQNLHQELLSQINRSEKSAFTIDERYVGRDQSVLWVNLTASVIRDEQGNFEVLAAIIQDISDRKQLEAERQQAETQLRHNALHDALTQLPNRNLLMTQLERALERVKRPPHQEFAVLFLDLDRFKLVNDSLGHMVGDQLLTLVAQALGHMVRPGDLVARLGGDEFVILLDMVSDTAEVLTVANRLLDRLRQPFAIAQREVLVTASIGIVMGSLAYRSAMELLRDADIAMYRAKANGKNSYAMFDPILHAQVTDQLQLEQDLRRAIATQQLELHYQPIVNLHNGDIYGVEALCRWRHPKRGLISPSEFIPIAEETGLIVEIDQWAITTACHQVKQWQQRYAPAQALKVSVNLSAQDLQMPNLVEHIRQALEVSGLAGEYLVLEITESLLVGDSPQLLQLVAQIQQLTVQLAIDDFGTGYSSLSYLHRFPLSALKIDQAFTSNLQLAEVNQEIVETIVTLGDRLGMIAIAEGGETLEQLQHLRQVGCDYSQGFYFSRPLPIAEIEPLLNTPHPFRHQVPASLSPSLRESTDPTA